MSGFTAPRWLRAQPDDILIGAEVDAGRQLFHLMDGHRIRCSRVWCLQVGDSPTEGDLADLCPDCVALARQGPA